MVSFFMLRWLRLRNSYKVYNPILLLCATNTRIVFVLWFLTAPRLQFGIGNHFLTTTEIQFGLD